MVRVRVSRDSAQSRLVVPCYRSNGAQHALPASHHTAAPLSSPSASNESNAREVGAYMQYRIIKRKSLDFGGQRKLFGRMIRMMTHPTKGRLALALVASFAGGASANYDNRYDAKNNNFMSELQGLIALSPVQVLESLDEYDKFWVEALGGRWV